MKGWILSSALAGGVLLAMPVFGQSASPSGPPTKATLEQVIAAWASMDVSKPAPFYAKDAGLVFYDIAPRKFTGWAEYEKTIRDMFKTVRSLRMKVNDDAQVRVVGTVAWATATIDGEMVGTDGSKTILDGRWTSVWERRPSGWLIVHEHFSMPMSETAPTPPPAR